MASAVKVTTPAVVLGSFLELFNVPIGAFHPLVAQLVERWTVEAVQTSIGRWFKSGPEDVLTYAYVCHACSCMWGMSHIQDMQDMHVHTAHA